MRTTIGITLFSIVICTYAEAQAPHDSSEVTIIGPSAPSPPEMVARDDEGQVTMRAVRLEEPLVLDGRLDDPVYGRVPAVSDFVQQEPHEGDPATEETELWVFYDDEKVYIAARCWDSQPSRMVVNEMRRDNDNIYRNENLSVILDTFYDRRNGLFFQTNPLGALRDQAVTDEGQGINSDWNTVWEVGSSRFDEGWITEIAIPFKSLRYKRPGPQVWGINARRIVSWKNETSFLNPVAASYQWRGLYQLSRAATVVGIEAPLQSRNLELKPYAITTTTTNLDAEPAYSNDFGADAGFDLKYGLTKGLIADFTLNTDFAQVEEDQVQVNLTRFSLFFPEKREFFLEGQGIFSFGGVEARGVYFSRPDEEKPKLTPVMFFSRRIGLSEEGIVPISVGGRVTGREGKYRIGALSIQTRESEAGGVPSTNHSVFRLRRDILRRSDIGVIATNRSHSVEAPESSNSLFGVDANFTFYENLKVNTYYSRTWTPELYSSDVKGQESYLAKLDYFGDRYGLLLEHLFVGERFQPELGFLMRSGFRRNHALGRFSPRPQSIEAVRRFVWEAGIDYITGTEGTLETRRLTGAFRIELESGDETALEYTNSYEFLTEDFEIRDGIIIPVDGYDFQSLRAIYQFGPQRVVPGYLTFRTGSFFNGNRREVAYSGRIEVTSKFSIEPRFAVNWVDLREDDFVDKIVSTRFNYTFTPRMQLSSLIQFNSSVSSLASSIRYRWEYQPGSDLFVVYSDGRDTRFSGFPGLVNRTFAVKFTRLFRL
jgi:hypothetical protein